jgi:hypothetical protein
VASAGSGRGGAEYPHAPWIWVWWRAGGQPRARPGGGDQMRGNQKEVGRKCRVGKWRGTGNFSSETRPRDSRRKLVPAPCSTSELSPMS